MIAPNESVISAELRRIQLQPNLGAEGRRSLQRHVVSSLDDGIQRVIVDCSEWTDLDLMLLSSLMACAIACNENGVDFELENLSGHLRSSIEALHVGGRIGLADERALH